MKIKTSIAFLLLITLFQYSNAQQSQTLSLKVENHLKGDLDYTHEALNLVQKQANGEEISLGKVTTDGSIHFNLPEFDIKALYDSIPLQPQNFFSMFLMNSDCKDRDVFAETPFREAYAQKFDPIYIKNYGENVAILFPATDEKLYKNNYYYEYNSYDGKVLTTGSKYFWFYMDRSIAFKDDCIKTPLRNDSSIELAIGANIQFKKGWNFVEEKLVSFQNYNVDGNQGVLPKKIQFSQSSLDDKKVKWFLVQIMKDEKIEAAKKLYELDPITKEQFENWLPEKAGDFSRTSYELDKVIERSSSTTNNAVLVFENGNQKIEVAIIDGAKSPDDLEMINFAFAMDEELEREDKPASDTSVSDSATKGKAHYISKEDLDNKTAQVYSLFKDRIVLMAKGENMTAVQLWEAVEDLDIAAIIE